MKYAVSSLMVAVSALAFSANANASDFKPYVGLDYNYTCLLYTSDAADEL